ncbi:Outer membrane lipoprotein Blc precursor [compost metagenome]
MFAAALLRTGSLPRRWHHAFRLACLGLVCSLSACTYSTPQRIQVIQNFDAARYAGSWYVLARIDHPEEQGLVQTGVHYRSHSDGSLSMVQRGLDPASRQWSKRVSLAQPAGSPSQGALKISPLGPFSSAYNVVALDADYRWALVLGASADRAWVLSRTASLPAQASASLLQQARSAGVNIEQLLWVPQERLPSATPSL